jgi:hypothetical protein
LVLTPDGDGKFRHDFTGDTAEEKLTAKALIKSLQGKWRITITPFDDQWKIQNTIYLPQSEFIEIAPDLTQAN